MPIFQGDHQVTCKLVLLISCLIMASTSFASSNLTQQSLAKDPILASAETEDAQSGNADDVGSTPSEPGPDAQAENNDTDNTNPPDADSAALDPLEAPVVDPDMNTDEAISPPMTPDEPMPGAATNDTGADNTADMSATEPGAAMDNTEPNSELDPSWQNSAIALNINFIIQELHFMAKSQDQKKDAKKPATKSLKEKRAAKKDKKK
jgi:hypothetical protein